MKQTVRTQQKQQHIYRHYRRRYPNAADPQYFLDKLVDGILAVAACMGTVTVFLYLAIL